MMKPFPRRYYHSLGQIWHDFRAIAKGREQIHGILRGKIISTAFRERLMLVVTAVNGCCYCSYFHTRQAQAAGLNPVEIMELCAGSMLECSFPADELPALLYAQHWAETEGQPDPAARARILDTYGEPKTQAIEFSLRMIQSGNLSGNTLDYLIYRISFGRWGGERKPHLAALEHTV
jgi:AhpD family alkylhydroperoxidase